MVYARKKSDDPQNSSGKFVVTMPICAPILHRREPLFCNLSIFEGEAEMSIGRFLRGNGGSSLASREDGPKASRPPGCERYPEQKLNFLTQTHCSPNRDSRGFRTDWVTTTNVETLGGVTNDIVRKLHVFDARPTTGIIDAIK